MKKAVIFSIFVFSLLLISCGNNNIQGMSVLDTEDQEEQTFEEERVIAEQKTATDMLEELQKSMEIKQESKTGTFYGEIDISTEGKDALKEKTKALFEKEFFNLSVNADQKQGARYH